MFVWLQRQFAERPMHCLFVVSFIHVCARIAFMCWRGQHSIVFGPFPTNESLPQANMSGGISKQTVHSALGVVQNIPANLY